MATTDARGTKRTCQNPECGSRFYDLNHSPIVCPICGASYVLASGGPVAPLEDENKKLRKAAPVAAAQPVAADEDADDALVSLEEADAEIAGDDDETFLEEEEEAGGDVTDIVGGAAEADEEP